MNPASIDLSGIDPLQTEEHLVLSFAVYKMIGLVRKECKAGGDAATAFGSAEGALWLGNARNCMKLTQPQCKFVLSKLETL